MAKVLLTDLKVNDRVKISGLWATVKSIGIDTNKFNVIETIERGDFAWDYNPLLEVRN